MIVVEVTLTVASWLREARFIIAAYLQVITQIRVSLATVDEDMRSAARRLEIPLLPA